jgi:hypothetical protein
MNPLDWNRLTAVHSEQMPAPETIPTASTIAPKGRFTIITGNNVPIANIVPPTQSYHQIALLFLGPLVGNPVISGAGNIEVSGTTPIAPDNAVAILHYNPKNSKYYPERQLNF